MADALELGSCTGAELPQWFVATTRKLGIDWQVDVTSNVRGGKRTRIGEWLRGEKAEGRGE